MKIIQSENPNEHWNEYKKIEDSIVLDLGCGWLHLEHESTPEYFIQNGCKHLIGVDASGGEIHKLQEQFRTHTFITKVIREKEDITTLLEKYKPTLIKMDIEGYESLLDEIESKYFDSVEEIMIEYHNPQCKEIVHRKLQSYRMQIVSTAAFGWFCTDTNIMGVVYAKR